MSEVPERPSEWPAEKVRVLIVDDSALMRRLLVDLLGSAPELEIVGFARNGREAVEQASRLRPDVVTLDVEMPEVSGLDALPAILALGGIAVVMISALTREGADATLHALELGAFDVLPKPEAHQFAALRAGRDALISKVLAAALSRTAPPGRRPWKAPSRPFVGLGAAVPGTVDDASSELEAEAALNKCPDEIETACEGHVAPRSAKRSEAGSSALAAVLGRRGVVSCVVIGVSTGGPRALGEVLPALAPPLPPIVLVQHMMAEFVPAFAARLDRQVSPAVRAKEAETGDLALPNQILVAPGDRHLFLRGRPPSARAMIVRAPEVSGHRPSIDVLFRSAAEVYRSAVVGILMTGMGRDGVDGCAAIVAAGGLVLGQDEASSAVYGMNKAAFEEGAIQAQFALDELPAILQALGAAFSAPPGGPN